MSELFDAVREAAGPRVWGAAVELARAGGVQGVSDDGNEICLQVKSRGKAVPNEVYLWPNEPDWGCDCGLPGDACVHVAAATIAVREQGRSGAKGLPQPKKSFRVSLRYAFRSGGTRGEDLELSRKIVWPDGREEPLKGVLADNDLIATREDGQVEVLLALLGSGPLGAPDVRRLMKLLGGRADATLDGKKVELDARPVPFRVRLEDEGEGFRLRLVRPGDIDKLFRGAALREGRLHPTSHGQLMPEQRTALLKGVSYQASEVGVLVQEVLPKMEDRIPVDIATERLPTPDLLVPQVQLSLKDKPGGLEVEARIVYGDPPAARVTVGGALEKLRGEAIVARDLAAERTVQRAFETKVGLTVGFRHMLSPEKAVDLLTHRLIHHDGPTEGRVDPARYQVVRRSLQPKLMAEPAALRGGGAGWALDVDFEVDGHRADPDVVLQAWRSGRSLVPLLDGGFAPLPHDWLDAHGALLRELLEARDAQGMVDRQATAALVELLEDVDAEVPPDLSRLRQFLAGEDGLPEAVLPDGLSVELRPYQLVGFRWLRFLRDMELHGVLADDMGLGKTVQALAAMVDAGGRAMVVAPTSVLRNWQREAARFAPSLSVNVYHGPGRDLSQGDLVLTSYAIMRLDLERLQEVPWTYLVLDEAQAIKNPTSQTAKAACKLGAKHRLCLTGTPVENRLEELWSLFRFLMPGLLGSLSAFRDRFVRPMEAGEPKAAQALRQRVRPYIMRRLKQQVATELPPLTEMVIRCEMGEAQRRVYEAVRLAAREDVLKLLTVETGAPATIQVLEALLRMRQACCDPSLLPGEAGAGAPSSKLDALEELLVDLVMDGHKALVFSQWTSLLDRVEPRLKELGIAFVRLDGGTRDRQAVIDQFQSPEGPPVFLLSLKAGGTGLNLTAADYVLHLDPWWNPAVEQQATDRAHRIGQDKPVVSVKLVAERTVEERILELQEAKRQLADAALGEEGGFLKTLSAEELRSLFEEV